MHGFDDEFFFAEDAIDDQAVVGLLVAEVEDGEGFVFWAGGEVEDVAGGYESDGLLVVEEVGAVFGVVDVAGGEFANAIDAGDGKGVGVACDFDDEGAQERSG